MKRPIDERIVLTDRERKLAQGYIKRLHVDKRMIAQRAPNPLTIQTSSGSIKATRVRVNGPSEFVYQPNDPLSCGARLWIETDSEVEVIE